MGSRQNPNTPIFIQANNKLSLLSEKYIPIEEIKEPKQINLMAFKKHLYLSKKIEIKNEPNTPDKTKDAPIILASLELNLNGWDIGLITVARHV